MVLICNCRRAAGFLSKLKTSRENRVESYIHTAPPTFILVTKSLTHLNLIISMLTLHTVLQTFLMVLTIKGNLFNNHGLFQLMTFPILSRP